MTAFHSSRLPTHLDADALAEPPADGAVIDLTLSNPTRCGFVYPALPTSLWQPFGAPYTPMAMGPWASRQALADVQTLWGRATTADQLMLTASTSEALSYLFKMALDPGSIVATAIPGYPLVPHLAELEGLVSRTFALTRTQDGVWQLDLDAVHTCLQEGAKALVFVSPNNPTGAYLTAEACASLAPLCNRYGALAIFDEVFAPYHRKPPYIRLLDLSGFDRAVSLGGLSKAGLMPQLKLSWIDVHGTKAFRAATLAGLEWVGDAYLSLGQTALALPHILPALPHLQEQARTRIAANAAHVAACLRAFTVGTMDAACAGWYAVIRPHGDGPLVRRAERARQHVADVLLQSAQVNLHPGFLYDLPGEHVLVASLIGPEAQAAAGWRRTCRALAE